MSSTVRDILFDLGSMVALTTVHLTTIGQLLPAGNISGLPVSFRGVPTPRRR